MVDDSGMGLARPESARRKVDLGGVLESDSDPRLGR